MDATSSSEIVAGLTQTRYKSTKLIYILTSKSVANFNCAITAIFNEAHRVQGSNTLMGVGEGEGDWIVMTFSAETVEEISIDALDALSFLTFH